jgi:hypothetical protein
MCRPRLSLTVRRIVSIIFLLLAPVCLATQAAADDAILDSAISDSAYYPEISLPAIDESQ